MFEHVCDCTMFTVIITKMRGQVPFLTTNGLVNSWKEQHKVHRIVHRSNEQSIMLCHVAVRALFSLHQEIDADAPLNNLQEVLALLLILCQNLIVVLGLCYSTFSEVFDGSNPAYNLFDDWKEASFSHSEGFFAKKSHYEYCKMLYLAYKIPSVESQYNKG